MAKLKDVVVVLLVTTLILSVISVVFNVVIFKMNSANLSAVKGTYSSPSSSNVGSIGLSVEGNSPNSGGNNG